MKEELLVPIFGYLSSYDVRFLSSLRVFLIKMGPKNCCLFSLHACETAVRDVEVDFHGERRVITVQPGDSILEAVSGRLLCLLCFLARVINVFLASSFGQSEFSTTGVYATEKLPWAPDFMSASTRLQVERLTMLLPLLVKFFSGACVFDLYFLRVAIEGTRRSSLALRYIFPPQFLRAC